MSDKLKRYILLASGWSIDQKSEPVDDKDIVTIGKDIYIKYKDSVLDGYAYPYYGLTMVVGSWDRESTFEKHYFDYRKWGKYLFNAVQQCIAEVNANAEYYIKKNEDIYHEHMARTSDKAEKARLQRSLDNQNSFYKNKHLAMEELKRAMHYQGLYHNCEIDYFGQGGGRTKKRWYDTPFNFNKTNIDW